MFQILVVDDDRAGAYLLERAMKNFRFRPVLHFVWDGLEALDFLHRRGRYSDAPRPNLILLDINMPRLGGVETLSAIKNDPELYVIPIIMLSTSGSPDDVRDSYEARANCYLQKPVDLDKSEKLVQAIETFWMELVLLPGRDARTPHSRQLPDFKKNRAQFSAVDVEDISGSPIALEVAEASRRATFDSPEKKIRRSGCEAYNRLLDEFGTRVQHVIELHRQQFLAIAEDDSECFRFDVLIHMANEKKQRAKYAYLRHVEAHGCSNEDEFKQT
jgi:chemotaxis family two-component system response regulator Rcp1